jgi:hypothetical protein
MQPSPGWTVGEAEDDWPVTEMAREALANMQEQYERIRQDLTADAQQKLALRERRLQNAEARANHTVARLQVYAARAAPRSNAATCKLLLLAASLPSAAPPHSDGRPYG